MAQWVKTFNVQTVDLNSNPWHPYIQSWTQLLVPVTPAL